MVRSSAGDRTRAEAAPQSTDVFAPELPLDALRRVLAPLAGDVATLCAAACVSRTWRDASRERALWAALTQWGNCEAVARPVPLTDARLAEVVRRAGSGVGGEPHLEQLDVTRCTLVTARGVAAALAGAGLEGKLTLLHVANTISVEEDDVLDVLNTFLQSDLPQPATLDVTHLFLCDGTRDCDGRKVDCLRLCVETRCDSCEDVWRCDHCYEAYERDFDGDEPLCEHMCADCGKPGAYYECEGCEEDEHKPLCSECLVECANDCGFALCVFHGSRHDTHMVRCLQCNRHTCTDKCILWIEHPLVWCVCALCDDRWCDDCVDHDGDRRLHDAAHWAAQLGPEPGGVSADVVERLLDWGQKHNADDEYNELCVRCARDILNKTAPPAPAAEA
jgi:hypothetical protein